MTTEEWAKLLNGREYCKEMTSIEEKQAKEDGVIIVFGASDDLLEFRGVINDEVGAWEGKTVKITPDSKLYNESKNKETLQYNSMQIANMLKVQAIWCPKNENGDIWASWEIRSKVRNKTFDIMEDGEIFCRGIVFKWTDAENFMK